MKTTKNKDGQTCKTQRVDRKFAILVFGLAAILASGSGIGVYADVDPVHFADGVVADDTALTAAIRNPSDRVEELIEQVIQSEVPAKRTHPLLATLEAARTSFQSHSLTNGIDQLEAFQNKVKAQLAPKYGVLAAAWIGLAQEIIDAAVADAHAGTVYDLGHFPFNFGSATDVHGTLETSAYGTYTTPQEIENFFNHTTYSVSLNDGTTTLCILNNQNTVWHLSFEALSGNLSGISAVLTCTPTELTLDFSTPEELSGAGLLLQGSFQERPATFQYRQLNNRADFNFVDADFDAVHFADFIVPYDAPFIFPALVRDPPAE